MLELKDWSYEEFPEYKNSKYVSLKPQDTHFHISYKKDVIFKDDLKLQLLIPENKEKHPCLLYVQGSAWDVQDLYNDLIELSEFARRGYLVALVQYRDYNIAPFPAPIEDARDAVKFLKENSEKYQIDIDHIYMSGNSSGGHTAVFASIDNKDIRACINYYGATTLMTEDGYPSTPDHCLPSSPEGKEAGGVNLLENEALRKAMSAECNITESTYMPPVLSIHGTKDRIVNTECSVILHEHLLKTKHQSELLLIEGGDHGGQHFFAKEVFDIIDNFLKRW